MVIRISVHHVKWLEQCLSVDICFPFVSTGDKCVLNFKPCGMFGKELHKIEGHIQDKRWVSTWPRRRCWNRSSLNGIRCLEPVRRSGGWSMESGRKAFTAWTPVSTTRSRNRTRRQWETLKSWNRWAVLRLWADGVLTESRVKSCLEFVPAFDVFYLSHVTWSLNLLPFTVTCSGIRRR